MIRGDPSLTEGVNLSSVALIDTAALRGGVSRPSRKACR